jgi:tetratricopeptide (TPR) repeat protein
VRVMHEIGWRDGESFVAMNLSMYSQARGNYARAWQAGQTALAIATDIGHRQWMAGGHYTLGLLFCDLHAWPQALQHLESGLALSREIRSLHWMRCHAGILAMVYVESGSPDRAEAVLSTVSDIRQPPQSVGERLVTFGRACLAHARGDHGQALEAIDNLVSAAGPSQPGETESAIPLLFLKRGSLLAELGRIAQAEADFRAAIVTATADGERPLLWRLRQALGRLLETHGLPAEAAEQFEQARSIVAEPAADLPEPELRDTFRRGTGLFA